MSESNQDAISQDTIVDPEIGSPLNSPESQGATLDAVSTEFVGRWTRLISTTNWEKGKIIYQWRQALKDASEPPTNYSDETWSRQVGGVTAQHVGRLRRVHERFGESYRSFQGLYWSHFLAALDWDDAEMWLEGAAQSDWSVSQMRRTRWESMGADPQHEPRQSDLQSTSDDEDFVPLSEVDSDVGAGDSPKETFDSGPRYDEPDFGDADSLAGSSPTETDDDLAPWEDADGTAAPQENPFAKLPSLPTDMEEALEMFKLAIVRHRSSQWSEVSQESVIKALDALRSFAAQ